MTSRPWTPARSLAECEAILQAPGSPWETEEITVKTRTFRAYKRLPRSAREFWLSTQRYAERDYVVFELERYTYSQMHAKVAALSHLLIERGVKKGDKVALLSRNYPEWIMTFWSTHVLGAVLVGLNAWNPVHVNVKLIEKTTPTVLIVDDERALQLAPHLDAVRAAGCTSLLLLRAGDGIPGYESLEEVMNPHEVAGLPYPEVEIHPEDPFVIFFTSGTTSIPKGVLQTQRQGLTNILNGSVATARASLRRGEPLPDLTDPNRKPRAMLLGIPLFHVTGCHSYLFQGTGGGGKVVLMRKWSLQEALRLIGVEKITTAGGVPYLVMELMAALQEDPNHSLQGFSFGGAPSPHGMTDRFSKMKAKMTLQQAYGSTETSCIVVAHMAEDYLARPTSTGVACPVNELAIRHLETEEPLPIGSEGEIWIKGVNIAEGYYNDPEASKVFQEDGWFRTGDVGRLDEEGFLYISGRAKEIIIRGGENISATQVESALYEHPAVQEAAAVPVPDQSLGELVSACVVLKPAYQGKVTAEELISFSAKQLPRHCVPVLLHIREELLDRNASGKVLKTIVKEDMGKRWEAQGRKAIKAKL